MPYRHEKCKAGKTIQHTYYYAPRADTKEGSRRKKENKTSEAQKKVNSRHAVKKLTWILNENFDGTSLYITWSYDKEKRPDGKEALRADMDGLLRGIRKIYKAERKTAKYVWAAEVGERGAAHIHMVLNAIDTAKLKKCWDKGWITIKPLDDSGQYRRLAEYFVKYSEKTMKTCEGFSNKRYNSSKNLKIPQPDRTTVRSRNAYSHTIEVPHGYYVDKDSIAEAWHEVSGYMYFTYTLIDGRKQGTAQNAQPAAGDIYTLNLDTGEIQITEKPRKEKKMALMKRKQFYSVVRRGKIVGVAEQSGFEIEIDGKLFNAYRDKDEDRAYIIDPQTGLAVCIYEYEYGESGMPTEIEMIKRAKYKLMTKDKECFEKWRTEERSKESYKLTAEMFAAYIKAEELREKQKEAVLRESCGQSASGQEKEDRQHAATNDH